MSPLVPDASALPVHIQGFTWGAVGSWGAFLTLVGLLIRQWVPLKRLGQEGDAAFRADMFKEMGELRDAVADARKETAEERRRCDEELRQIRSEHDQVVRELRAEIKGLHTQMVSWQISSQRPMAFGVTPEADKAAGRLIERLSHEKGIEE